MTRSSTAGTGQSTRGCWLGLGTLREGNLLENNTFVNTAPPDHKLSHLAKSKSGTRNCTFRNNLFVVGGKPVFALTLKQSGTISAAAVFVHLAKGDLRVKEGSACTRAGAATMVDDNTSGTARGIGALEKGGQSRVGCRAPWRDYSAVR